MDSIYIDGNKYYSADKVDALVKAAKEYSSTSGNSISDFEKQLKALKSALAPFLDEGESAL